MSEDDREYVVLARRPETADIKSIVKAINIQEATRKAVKLLNPRMNFREVAIVEIAAGVTDNG